MMNWNPLPLGKILQLDYGKPLPARMRDSSGEFFVAGSNGPDGTHSEAIVKGPGIVVGRKGSAGKVNWYENDFWPIDTTYYVVPNDGFNLRWLLYLLKYLNLENLSTGAGVPGLNRNDAYKVEVPVFPPSEQHRIVEILDQADRLRQLRQEADQKVKRILPALFIKMFGDPATNPMGWDFEKIGNISEDIESGWSPSCETRQAVNDEWGVLKLGAITPCVYDELQNKALPLDLEPRLQLEVKTGDLLFSRKNTRNLVGATVFVFETREKLMIPDLIFRINLDQNAVPEFVWQALINPHLRTQIQLLASGAVTSMVNISKAKFREFTIPLPPIETQLKFKDKVHNHYKLLILQISRKVQIDTLFKNIIHRAFSGELTASWREAHMKELLQEMGHQTRLLRATEQ